MRLLSRAIVLTAFCILLCRTPATDAWAQTVPAADTSRIADQPLTGRALPCEGGRVKSFACQNVELLSHLPPSMIGDAGGGDIWGWTDSATGREFAIIGTEDRAAGGTSFVEVTDPVNPKYLGRLPFHVGASDGGAMGVKVYKNHAFIVAAGANNGMQVFDLTQLRDVKTAPMEFQETARYTGITYTHTLTMDEASGFAYPTGGSTCGGGLHMVDVRTPTKPTFVGCYAGSGWTHDAQCVVYHGPDKDYQGRQICLKSVFEMSASAVEIVDVTEKQQPKQISIASYPTAVLTHQGWLTDDHRYFFLDDEHDEIYGVTGGKTRTIVFDLNDLDDPVVLTQFYGTTNATDHNLYIRGRYMYQANYAAGLRIIDIADPEHPKEVGYLDTSPELDGPGMDLGSWGNYPFFKNDVVAVSDAKGLFLVRLLSR